jgi:hypothetical protein
MYCMYLLQISYRLTIKPLINKTQRLPSEWVAIFKKLPQRQKMLYPRSSFLCDLFYLMIVKRYVKVRGINESEKTFHKNQSMPGEGRILFNSYSLIFAQC